MVDLVELDQHPFLMDNRHLRRWIRASCDLSDRQYMTFTTSELAEIHAILDPDGVRPSSNRLEDVACEVVDLLDIERSPGPNLTKYELVEIVGAIVEVAS